MGRLLLPPQHSVPCQPVLPSSLSHSPLVKLNQGSESLAYRCHHSAVSLEVGLGGDLYLTIYSDSQDYHRPHMTPDYSDIGQEPHTHASKAVSDIPSSGALCSKKTRSTMGWCTLQAPKQTPYAPKQAISPQAWLPRSPEGLAV